MTIDPLSDPVLIIPIETAAAPAQNGTTRAFPPATTHIATRNNNNNPHSRRLRWFFLAGTIGTALLLLLRVSTVNLVDPTRHARKQQLNVNNNNAARNKNARLSTADSDHVAILPLVPDTTTTTDATTTTTTPATATRTTGKINMPVHAAELLECRESVVNFVINATDGKDECEGLKKAFDKTCSNDDTDNDNDDNSSGDAADPTARRRRLKKKQAPWTMWEKTRKTFRFRALAVETYQLLQQAAARILGPEQVFFFAEDEFTMQAWDDATYLVNNNLDYSVHEKLRRKLERDNARDRSKKHNRQRQLLEQPASNKTKTSSMTSLALPTSNQHVSSSTLSETLMLQQGHFEKASNQSAAATDAAASSKAMKESNAAVQALLNDPTSIEARTCCASILNVYHENCSTDPEQDVSDVRLVFCIFVMACCGVVKSLIRHYRILWLPEAAGCIIVGVLSGYCMMLFPHEDISFDGNWFLRILVPPIVFEAALGIDKRSFNRHVVPIIIYAVAGTLVATVLTAMIVHRGSLALQPLCSPIPYVEALTYGALISSIDPIAVLSVLSNMGMTDTDTIYVVIFGESLLNDGVAIVLFETLVHFLDENLVIDGDAVFAASIHFLVVAFGSLLVGVASGMLSTVYYWLFHGCQTALVEVLMFFCWALLPYYICDGIGWSGIVSAVATGFVMDLYVVGDKDGDMTEDSEHSSPPPKLADQHQQRATESSGRHHIFSGSGHLSQESRTHIGFVTEMISTVMETVIFAYLGLFLFSHRYHWNVFHTTLAIFACCASRAIMIPSLSLVANSITRIQQTRAACRKTTSSKRAAPNAPAGVVIDIKMQVVLWFAGLRGAMSFALVEHIPLYDDVSGEGTRLKPELKAMTSATIMFTVFILGGYTYYVMENLGLAPSAKPRKNQQPPAQSFEMTSLVGHSRSSQDLGDADHDAAEAVSMDDSSSGQKTAFRRTRHATSELGAAS